MYRNCIILIFFFRISVVMISADCLMFNRCFGCVINEIQTEYQIHKNSSKTAHYSRQIGCFTEYIHLMIHVSRAMRKYVLCHMQTTKAQISLRIRAVWSAPCCSLLREYNISRFYSQNFKTLASFCGCAGRFVSGLVGNSRRHIFSCRGSCMYSLNKVFYYCVPVC